MASDRSHPLVPPSAGPASQRSLSRAEAEAVLARQHAGRLAFSSHNRISIALVWYVYLEGWIYARMVNDGTRTFLEHNQWVAFEVDEIESVLEWRTVSAAGSVQFLENDQKSAEWAAFNTGMAALRAVAPWIATSDDAFPERTQLYRIYIDEMSGRQSHPGHK